MSRRRPPDERTAVLNAAAMLPKRSARATAANIARQVAADCVAWVALDLADELVGGLAELEAMAKPTPVIILSRCPQIDTAAHVLDARSRRFRARGCRQISESEWRRETTEIVDEIAALLTERYRDVLKNRGGERATSPNRHGNLPV